tara:strand:- start:648 stop:1112 length:465 start_codon:yes stop_codon:yes gene_type:complete
MDQFTKYLVTRHIPLHHNIPVIGGFFHLTHIRNPGVAFGLFAQSTTEYKTMIFVTISTLAIVAILYFFYYTPSDRKLVINGLTLICGGAIGNLIDRVLYKEVIDFLDFFIGYYHWPAFNIADSCITIGVGMMIVDSFVGEYTVRQIQKNKNVSS